MTPVYEPDAFVTTVEQSQCRWCRRFWLGTNIERHERLCAYRITCPKCGAPPQASCRYPNGKRSPGAHAKRRVPDPTTDQESK